MEVQNIVQEAVISHPQEKYLQKAKMVVWGSLINSWLKKRKRERSWRQGEKEIYTHLNAEFQGRAKRDKKAFLSDQCKEIVEDNRMGKTRDLIKKIRYTKDWCWSWNTNTWPPNTNNWIIGKDADVGKDWRQEEKGTTEDEMVEWHHRLYDHEFQQASGAHDMSHSQLQVLFLLTV